MHHWKKSLLALAAPLILTGCLWGPGKFTSVLDLRKDGSFTLDYRGEMVIAIPEDPKSEPGSPDALVCATSSADGEQSRPCTPTELADHARQISEKAAAKAKESAEMAKLFGLPGLDDDSARAFAAKLTKYAGWRSVIYRGKGVFEVDYHFAGRATQDFLFPALPDNALIIPFIAIRRRTDGSVLVTAPAMTGKGGLFGGMGGSGGSPVDGPASRAEGRLTLTTDGLVLTNNSEDGPQRTAAGQQLHWDVTPSSAKVPETLIRLQ